MVEVNLSKSQWVCHLYEKAIHYVENIGIINFSPINNAIDDNRIIRMSISTILNPMDVEIIKI